MEEEAITNKRWRIPKGQSKMDNQEKLETWGTQDEEKHSTICVEHNSQDLLGIFSV